MPIDPDAQFGVTLTLCLLGVAFWLWVALVYGSEKPGQELTLKLLTQKVFWPIYVILQLIDDIRKWEVR